MCIRKTRHSLIFSGKLCKLIDNVDHLALYKLKSVAHNDNICVIANVAGGCTKVNDTLCVGTSKTVGINVSHNIVADKLFTLCRSIIINVFDVCFKLVDLRLSYGQTKLHFCSCKSHPKAAPCGEFLICGKDILHFLAGISCAEGGFIAVIRHFQ